MLPFSARWSMRARAGAIMPPVPCVPGHQNVEPSNGLQSNFLCCLEPPCSADSRNAFGVTLSKTSCSLLRGTQFLFSAFLLSRSLGSDPLHDIVSSVCSTNILGVFLLCEVWGLPCEQGRCTHVHGPLFQGRSWSQARADRLWIYPHQSPQSWKNWTGLTSNEKLQAILVLQLSLRVY